MTLSGNSEIWKETIEIFVNYAKTVKTKKQEIINLIEKISCFFKMKDNSVFLEQNFRLFHDIPKTYDRMWIYIFE